MSATDDYARLSLNFRTDSEGDYYILVDERNKEEVEVKVRTLYYARYRNRAELEFRYQTLVPYAWMGLAPYAQGGHCTIKFSEDDKPQLMYAWLAANGLYVLQRDLHHSESPHLTGDRHG